MSNPENLLWEGETWKRRDNSRFVGKPSLGITSRLPVIQEENVTYAKLHFWGTPIRTLYAPVAGRGMILLG